MGQYVHQITLTFSGGNLNKHIYPYINYFQSFTDDFSMIYSFFGMEP